MHINIIHRPEPDPFRRDVFKLQQDTVHELGMKTTIMATMPSLEDEACVALMKEYHQKWGDELGLSFHSLDTESLKELVGYKEVAIWLYNNEDKRKVIRYHLDCFREAFGFEPTSVASYHLDASSIRILLEECPSIEICIAGCFEEGVKVYHGCNHSWYLFNEGMPWNAWYPSKSHSLRPAENEEDAFGVVAVPHLTRDMALAYESRNDFWASHPPNVQRGMGNKEDFCPYDRNLIDQHRYQEQFNKGFSYLNIFVGAAWLIHNHNSEEPPSISLSLYQQQLQYIKNLIDAGKGYSSTITEFGKWYKQNVPIEHREVCLAKEILYGSGKHYFWYIDPYFRVLFDLNQGCSIGDLRPYIGKVSVETGIDSQDTYIGSYPYLIQSQYRTGYLNHFSDGTRTTAILKYGDIEVDLSEISFRCDRVFQDQSGFESNVMNVKFGDIGEAAIQTIVRFGKKGEITIERRVSEIKGNAGDDLQITEYLKACFGTTDYPVDQRSVLLKIDSVKPNSMQFSYKRREQKQQDVTSVHAELSSINTGITLRPTDGHKWEGSIAEGILFNPYFTLTLSRKVKTQTSCHICLSLKTIKKQ
jgi:hypothetical protein